jgi:Fe2+ or Zn2+ uptake regulation protein
MTIPQVLEADTRLAQSSAYRNLVVLEAAGVVTRIVTNDDFARYELAEHLTHHHHHLICSSCGDVTDFALDDQAEAGLDEALHKIAAATGFTVEAHRLDLVGVCSDCG